ncbi:hypothetical protein [Pseudoduganella namucuonensis]|uniref:Collagen-like protein n=1 Tax=Pseudoduganella namucuonensis TaxID=1035707 RepID=A0A1I7J5D4_9BURK|nr:hypothetical protein [Pseudoduganella namucuonensis]SFU80388.1 hypothetical protein SAMN05216552_101071 [Pseudoduganella namucuonensis]
MKLPILLAAVAALALTACEKTTVNNPPVVDPAPAPAVVPVPVPVPGPAGPPGAPGAPGEAGKPGDTVIVVPDANKPADPPR